MTTSPPVTGVCACACDCSNLVPAASHPLLAAHLRCSGCVNHPLMSANTQNDSAVTLISPATEEEKQAGVEAAREQKDAIWQAARDSWRASLPEKFRDAETTDPRVMDRLGVLASGHPEVASMILAGTIGQGKTWMAVAYANAAIARGLIHPGQVLFGTESEILASVANSPYVSVEAGIQKLVSGRYRMIIIDDVGRGTWLNQDMCPKLFSLVADKQYRDNHLLVVTTNLSKRLLREHIGEGAFDRLSAMTGYDTHVLRKDIPARRTTTEKSLKDSGK